MKPHITYDGFGWVCHSEDYFYSGYGKTPREAYNRWSGCFVTIRGKPVFWRNV